MVVRRKRLIFQHGQTRHLSVPMVAIGEYTETSMQWTMPTEVGRHHARLEFLRPESR
jgi:chloramphenicol O-acetyltransferase